MTTMMASKGTARELILTNSTIKQHECDNYVSTKRTKIETKQQLHATIGTTVATATETFALQLL